MMSARRTRLCRYIKKAWILRFILHFDMPVYPIPRYSEAQCTATHSCSFSRSIRSMHDLIRRTNVSSIAQPYGQLNGCVFAISSSQLILRSYHTLLRPKINDLRSLLRIQHFLDARQDVISAEAVVCAIVRGTDDSRTRQIAWIDPAKQSIQGAYTSAIVGALLTFRTNATTIASQWLALWFECTRADTI